MFERYHEFELYTCKGENPSRVVVSRVLATDSFATHIEVFPPDREAFLLMGHYDFQGFDPAMLDAQDRNRNQRSGRVLVIPPQEGLVIQTVDCVVCGRPGVGENGNRVHTGWCWWCVKNKMEGRTFDGRGNPFTKEALGL